MAEPNQSKLVIIPTRYNSKTRELIGNDIVRFIKNRTGDGLDVNRSFFSAYSKHYEKTGTVDLQVSRDMLNHLEVLSHGRGFIKIGFSSSFANDKAAWIQQPTGRKAGKQPVREFVGISQTDLNGILEKYRLEL